MDKKREKEYEAPRLTVVTFKTERGYAVSGQLSSVFGLGNSYSNSGDNAWDDSDPSGGGNRFSGWTDNGESAW